MNKRIFVLAFVLATALVVGILSAVYLLQGHETIIVSTQTHNPEEFIQSLAHDPKRGEKIVQQFCSTCHAKDAVIATNAPRMGDKKSFGAYAAMKPKQLLALLNAGIGDMPPRGGCFECSDELLLEAIQFMMAS